MVVMKPDILIIRLLQAPVKGNHCSLTKNQNVVREQRKRHEKTK